MKTEIKKLRINDLMYICMQYDECKYCPLYKECDKTLEEITNNKETIEIDK